MSFDENNLENSRFLDAAATLIRGYQDIANRAAEREQLRQDTSLSLRNREIAMEMAEMFSNYDAIDLEARADAEFGRDMIDQVVLYIHSDHCTFGPLIKRCIPAHTAIMKRAGVLAEGV